MANKKLNKQKKRATQARRAAAANGSTSKASPQEPLLMLRSQLLLDSENLYDKVLVDAECTHDGSLKHILKYNHIGWEQFEGKFLNPERLSSLCSLQRGLLSNGFRLLRPGGSLVYSTCSFSRAQNEDIVAWFLEAEGGNASLVAVDRSLLPDESCYSQFLQGTVRFDPVLHGTSGLFVAKLTKRS